MDLENLIQNKQWELLIRNILPVTISVSIPYNESMRIVAEIWNESPNVEGNLGLFLCDYAVNLMLVLRERFPEEWGKDWKNEAFLGICCTTVYREEEAFRCLKSSFDALSDPPQSLVLRLIRIAGPPNAFLEDEERVKLSQLALEKGITVEMAETMGDLVHSKEERLYWKKQMKEAEYKHSHTATIVPDCLKNILVTHKDYPYET